MEFETTSAPLTPHPGLGLTHHSPLHSLTNPANPASPLHHRRHHHVAGSGNDGDHLGYDTGASGETQGNLQHIISRLEHVLANRDRQVKAAMADFRADGVSDQYHGAEQSWHRAAQEVRETLKLLRHTLRRNDDIAHESMSRAKAIADSID